MDILIIDDDRSIRELLKEVSNEELTQALKGASDELKSKFFRNLSERAATMIQEDLEIMGPVRLADVEGAQQNVVKTVRRLEAEGKIDQLKGTVQAEFGDTKAAVAKAINKLG